MAQERQWLPQSLWLLPVCGCGALAALTSWREKPHPQCVLSFKQREGAQSGPGGRLGEILCLLQERAKPGFTHISSY